ncbi:MAG: HD domain-containing protein [Vicingaceae bacterium]
MESPQYNKKKIINDPVYGFISLPFDLIFDIIEHPYFQRLRRIKQLGLTHLVYPGALHTRFHHALGAMHLTMKAIEVIRSKGHQITQKEAKATALGILLHDIGHGPFSHALEYSIVQGVTHEDISSFFMQRLNREFKGKLDLAIEIFEDRYDKKPFLHQLISSQLDMDRLDYLKRDSFFTGVSEGVINSDRIISMLNVKDGQLCVEAKGIYSIEKFIIARRLMYWQVYLHKTVLSAESLVVRILKRAKELANQGIELFCTDALHYFLYQKIDKSQFESNEATIQQFAALDDFDITASIKMWTKQEDPILSTLCKSLLDRNLYRIKLSDRKIPKSEIKLIEDELMQLGVAEKDLDYFVFSNSIANNAYQPQKDKINLLYKNGETKDVALAADQLNISALSKQVKKYFLCSPKQPMVNNLPKLRR